MGLPSETKIEPDCRVRIQWNSDVSNLQGKQQLEKSGDRNIAAKMTFSSYYLEVCKIEVSRNLDSTLYLGLLSAFLFRLGVTYT